MHSMIDVDKYGSPWPSASPPPSPADAADKLDKAITFMIQAYLQKGLIKRADIVQMLDDVMKIIEKHE